MTNISQITGKFEVHRFDGDVMWTTERKLDRVSTEGLKFYIERSERLGIGKFTKNVPGKISSARAKIEWYKKKMEDSKSAKNEALRNSEESIEKLKGVHYKAKLYVKELEKSVAHSQMEWSKSRENLDQLQRKLEDAKVVFREKVASNKEELEKLQKSVECAREKLKELMETHPHVQLRISNHKLMLSRAKNYLKQLAVKQES